MRVSVQPAPTVVTITGGGGFLFTATELASAVQHGIAAITVVFNDNAFGNVRRIQQERFGIERTIASTLVNPDIVALAESFGCLGLRANDPHELGDALRTAMAHDGPVVIQVAIDEVPSPWPFIVMATGAVKIRSLASVCDHSAWRYSLK